MNPIWTIISGLVVALIGWRIAFQNGMKVQRQLKREHFSSFIELRLAKIKNVGAFALFFEESQNNFATFNKEVLEVRPHIKHKSAFNTACTAYRNLTASPLEEKNAKAKEQAIATLNQLLNLTKP